MNIYVSNEMLRERIATFGICSGGAGDKPGQGRRRPRITLPLAAVVSGLEAKNFFLLGDLVGVLKQVLKKVLCFIYGQVCKEINGLQVSGVEEACWWAVLVAQR